MRPRARRLPAFLRRPDFLLLAGAGALAVVYLGLFAGGRGPGPALSDGWNEADLRFFHQAIFAPMFVERPGPDGTPEMVKVRERSQTAVFRRAKAPGTSRVFIVGGSVGERFLRDEFMEGAGKGPLRRAWREALGGREVEIIDAAVPSYDSARELLVLREVLDYGADVVVLFSGNNENQDPAFDPSRLNLARAALRRWSGFRSIARALGRRRPPPRRRTGLEMATRFEAQVREMARLARGRGALLAACALPRNLRDCPPGNTLPLADRAFFEAWSAFTGGKSSAALERFDAFLARHPQAPFGHHYRGLSLLRLGRAREAREAFLRAAEASGGNGARPSLNEALRRVAKEEGAVLVDLEAAFSEIAEDGIPGWAQFDDLMHWHPALNPLINSAILEALRGSGALAGASWDAGALAALTRAGREALRPRGKGARELLERALLQGLWSWNTDPQRNDEIAIASFEYVLRRSPELLARLAGRAGRLWARERLRENVWTSGRLDRLDGLWAQRYDDLGETYRRNGLPAQAVKAFEASLAADGGRVLARLRLALALQALGRRSEALRHYRQIAGRTGLYPEISYFGEKYLSANSAEVLQLVVEEAALLEVNLDAANPA